MGDSPRSVENRSNEWISSLLADLPSAEESASSAGAALAGEETPEEARESARAAARTLELDAPTAAPASILVRGAAEESSPLLIGAGETGSFLFDLSAYSEASAAFHRISLVPNGGGYGQDTITVPARESGEDVFDIAHLAELFTHYQVLYGLHDPEQTLGGGPIPEHLSILRLYADSVREQNAASPDTTSRLEGYRVLAQVHAEVFARSHDFRDRECLEGVLGAWLEDLRNFPFSDAVQLEDLSAMIRLARAGRLERFIENTLNEAVQRQGCRWLAPHREGEEPRAAIRRHSLAYELFQLAEEQLDFTFYVLAVDSAAQLLNDARALEYSVRNVEPAARLQALGEAAAIYRRLMGEENTAAEGGTDVRRIARQRYVTTLERILLICRGRPRVGPSEPRAETEEAIAPALRLQAQLQVAAEFEAIGREDRASEIRREMAATAGHCLRRGMRPRLNVLERMTSLQEAYLTFGALGRERDAEAAQAAIRVLLEAVSSETSRISDPELGRQYRGFALEGYLLIGDGEEAARLIEEIRESFILSPLESAPPGAPRQEGEADPVLHQAQWLLRLMGYAQQIALTRSEANDAEADFGQFRGILGDLQALGEGQGRRTMELYARFMTALLDNAPEAESLYRQLQAWRPSVAGADGFDEFIRAPRQEEGEEPTYPTPQLAALFDTAPAPDHQPDPFQAMAQRLWETQRLPFIAERTAPTLQLLHTIIEESFQHRIAEAVNEEVPELVASTREIRDLMRQSLSHIQTLLAQGRASTTREAIQMLPEVTGSPNAVHFFMMQLGRAFDDEHYAGRSSLIEQLLEFEEMGSSRFRAERMLGLARSLILHDSVRQRSSGLIDALLRASHADAESAELRPAAEDLLRMRFPAADSHQLWDLYDELVGNDTVQQRVESSRNVAPYLQGFNQIVDQVFSVEGGVILLASIFTAGIAAELAGAAMLARMGATAFTVVNGVSRLTWGARIALTMTRMGAGFVARTAVELGGTALWRLGTGQRQMSWEELRLRVIVSFFSSIGDEFATRLTQMIFPRLFSRVLGMGPRSTHIATEVVEFFTDGLGELGGEVVGNRVAGAPTDDRPFLVQYFQECVHGAFFMGGNRAGRPLAQSILQNAHTARLTPTIEAIVARMLPADLTEQGREAMAEQFHSRFLALALEHNLTEHQVEAYFNAEQMARLRAIAERMDYAEGSREHARVVDLLLRRRARGEELERLETSRGLRQLIRRAGRQSGYEATSLGWDYFEERFLQYAMESGLSSRELRQLLREGEFRLTDEGIVYTPNTAPTPDSPSLSRGERRRVPFRSGMDPHLIPPIEGGSGKSEPHFLESWLAQVDDMGVNPADLDGLRGVLRSSEAEGLGTDDAVARLRAFIREEVDPVSRPFLMYDLASSLAQLGHLEAAHHILENDRFSIRDVFPDQPELWHQDEEFARIYLIKALSDAGRFDGEISPIYHLARIQNPSSRFVAWQMLLIGLVSHGQVSRAREILDSFERRHPPIGTPPEERQAIRDFLDQVIAESESGSRGGGTPSSALSALLAAGAGAATLLSAQVAQASAVFAEAAASGGSGWFSGAAALLGFGLLAESRSGLRPSRHGPHRAFPEEPSRPEAPRGSNPNRDGNSRGFRDESSPSEEEAVAVELEADPAAGPRPRGGVLVPGLISGAGQARIQHFRVQRIFRSGGRERVELAPLSADAVETRVLVGASDAGRLQVDQEVSLIPAIEGGSGVEEPALGPLQDLEASQLPLQDHLAAVEQEVNRLTQRLDSLTGRLEPEVLAAYREQIAELERRMEFWLEQQVLLDQEAAAARPRFARDIEIGQSLLLDRALRLMALIFAEPLGAESLSGRGLRDPWHIPPPRPTPSDGTEGTPRPAAGVLPALVNRDVGFGTNLALRHHQQQALNAVRGWLASQRERVESGERALPDFLQATIVMPVGGGKTRTMVAAFAEAIRQQIFQAGRGDKLILLNHTTQIHEQNLEVLARLGAYFQKTFGRRLRVSEYKAENKDLSGDVVVVNIPTVNNAERREAFSRELREALGEAGQVAMVAVDEVHHLELGRASGRESWTELLETLRRLSPHFFRLGFTATPTGREGRVLYRLREAELMRLGVTPRTYLVKVEGVDLSQLKVNQASGDFAARELGSTLLAHPERNRRILETLEARALRHETPSPSGRERLEGTILFAADLAHARMLAEAYQQHFGTLPSPRARRILSLGLERGRISSRELSQALRAYRSGEVAAVTAVVSGQTNLREEILQAVERGEIEAVFTVDALVEGADLHMFRNQVGARPTFSRIKRAQERGRINRRGPAETDAQGRLLQDPPRILFDVVDRYASHDRVLVRYGDVMGVRGHVDLPNGELFDALSESVVSQVDRDGQKVVRPDGEGANPPPPRPRPPADPEAESPFTPLIHILHEILDGQYQGDLEQLAMDLGESAAFVEGLLEGRGWENNQWFLRRLGTLLYQERDRLLNLFLEQAGRRDARVSPAEVQLLREALALYSELEGEDSAAGGLVWDGHRVAAKALQNLVRGSLGFESFKNLWVALANYCSHQVFNNQLSPELRDRANGLLLRLMEARSLSQGWSLAAQSPREALRAFARGAVAFRWGDVLPQRCRIEGIPKQKSQSILTRWLAGEEIQFGSSLPSKAFYAQVRSLLSELGFGEVETEALIRAAVFEERGWPQEAGTAREALLLEARRRVASHFGGILQHNHGIEGIPAQIWPSPLNRWLAGEEIQFGPHFPPKAFYAQVRSLLSGLGFGEVETEALIRAAVFEERGWPQEAGTAREALLLEARRRVASHFGGILQQKHGIEGVPGRISQSPLNRWLGGEGIQFSRHFPPKALYAQVRSLLNGLGFGEVETEALIRAAVFEERGWPQEAGTAREALLLEARRRVASHFGGILQQKHGIEGVPARISQSPLNRWLGGEGIQFGKNLPPQTFYAQVRSLLQSLGAAPSDVDTWISAAQREEDGGDDSGPLTALLAGGAGAATLLAAETVHAAVQLGDGSVNGLTGVLAGIAAALGAGVLGMAMGGRRRRRATPEVDAEYSEAVASLETQGRLAGEAGIPLPNFLGQVQDPFAAPEDPLWNLLTGLRQGAIKASRGNLRESVQNAVESFIEGALTTLGGESPPPFLRIVARVWGMESLRRGELKKLSPPEAEALGRAMGSHLQRSLSLGRAGGLANSVLLSSIHLRDISSFIAMRAWLEGTISRWQREGRGELAEILQANRGTIVNRALINGDLNYPQRVLEELPGMLRALETGIGAATDEAVREALRSNRGTIVNRALHSSTLDYPQRVIEALPGILQSLEEGVAAAPDEAVREALRSNRSSIVNLALSRGDLNYPQRVLERLPEMLRTLETGISAAPDEAVREALRSNRGTIVNRALNGGDLNYPQQVLEGLPEMLRTLEAGIGAARDHAVRRALQFNHGTIVHRALSRGDLNYPQRVLEGLPEMLRLLDAEIARQENPADQERMASIRRGLIHQALSQGNLQDPLAPLRGVTAPGTRDPSTNGGMLTALLAAGAGAATLLDAGDAFASVGQVSEAAAHSGMTGLAIGLGALAVGGVFQWGARAFGRVREMFQGRGPAPESAEVSTPPAAPISHGYLTPINVHSAELSELLHLLRMDDPVIVLESLGRLDGLFPTLPDYARFGAMAAIGNVLGRSEPQLRLRAQKLLAANLDHLSEDQCGYFALHFLTQVDFEAALERAVAAASLLSRAGDLLRRRHLESTGSHKPPVRWIHLNQVCERKLGLSIVHLDQQLEAYREARALLTQWEDSEPGAQAGQIRELRRALRRIRVPALRTALLGSFRHSLSDSYEELAAAAHGDREDSTVRFSHEGGEGSREEERRAPLEAPWEEEEGVRVDREIHPEAKFGNRPRPGRLVPGRIATAANPQIRSLRVARVFHSGGREMLELEPLAPGGAPLCLAVVPGQEGRMEVGEEVSFIPALEGGSGSERGEVDFDRLVTELFFVGSATDRDASLVVDRFLSRFHRQGAQEKAETIAALEAALTRALPEDSAAAPDVAFSFLRILLHRGNWSHAHRVFQALARLSPRPGGNLGYALDTLARGLQRGGYSPGELPELRELPQGEAAHFRTPAWLDRFRQALEDFPQQLEARALPVSLSQIFPIHLVDRHGEGGGAEALNAIRHNILYRLALQGWRPGQPPEARQLAAALLDRENRLPIVSATDEAERRLLLNGHHRVGALLTLAADGIFPETTLEGIPFHQAAAVSPRALIQRTFAGRPLPNPRSPLDWSHLLAFDGVTRHWLERQAWNQDLVAWIREVRT